MGGGPLRIHTDTLFARNGVINPLQSPVQTVQSFTAFLSVTVLWLTWYLCCFLNAREMLV